MPTRANTFRASKSSNPYTGDTGTGLQRSNHHKRWEQRWLHKPDFLVPKSDGSWRPVVNLKSLNTWVVPHHFKMESIRTVKGLLIQGDWLVKLDLKDAYLSIPIHRPHQKFLRFQRFQWDSREWQFQALPFGLSSAPSAPSR